MTSLVTLQAYILQTALYTVNNVPLIILSLIEAWNLILLNK